MKFYKALSATDSILETYRHWNFIYSWIILDKNKNVKLQTSLELWQLIANTLH